MTIQYARERVTRYTQDCCAFGDAQAERVQAVLPYAESGMRWILHSPDCFLLLELSQLKYSEPGRCRLIPSPVVGEG